MILPAPGQIWRDPRNPAREVRIEHVDDRHVWFQNTKTGRRSCVDRVNFTAIAILRNRWLFVRDAPGQFERLG